MGDQLTVFYLTDVPFPDGGMAAGNRILHLSKALIKGGARVYVLTALSDSKQKETMTIEGVEYVSLSDWCGWLGRNLTRYLLYYISAFLFIYKHRAPKMALYCYGINALGTIWAYLISCFMRCPLAREGAEFPYALISGASWWNVYWQIKVLKLFDGVIAITENLQHYYEKNTRRGCKVLHVPMTVDWNLFASETRPNPFTFEYIAYTGNMFRIGGGVDVLVAAFNRIASKFENLHLVLIGNGNDSLRKQYEKMLGESAKCRLHCLFGGDIARTEMPRYIRNAKLLALLPLPTMQQEGCFPTKLGEYMSAGVPTVISRVGNPTKCLTGGENIVFVSAGDVDVTAKAFSQVLQNYDKSIRIAQDGQRFAREHFDYAQHAKKLVLWYNDLVNK